MATTQPTTDDNSIVVTDRHGNVLTGAERRAVAAVVRKHQEVFDHADSLSPSDVGVKKRETGVLKIRLDTGVTVTDTTAKRALPDTWGVDSMMAHHSGTTAIEISHKNR